MALIFGFDIGTTSIGFAAIDHDPDAGTGAIKRLGVRIFPEARDPKNKPRNQERREARLRRRQLRRRRERRRLLGKRLFEAGLLPAYSSVKGSEWFNVMKSDPYALRRRAFEGEALTPHEAGRALYHLAKRRHFKGRDLEDAEDAFEPKGRQDDDAAKDERKAKAGREATLQSLKAENVTLGAWLAQRGPRQRKRGEHATRSVIENEFKKIWESQENHPEKSIERLSDPGLRESVYDAIFSQRPVFWRKNTLGKCRFFPGKPLCPRGSWLSQQKRMLEKINNLSLVGVYNRPLEQAERKAIVAALQTQASMTWGAVRTAVQRVFEERGETVNKRDLLFNLEQGGEKKLIGNAVEAKLARIFGGGWPSHPHKQEIRDAVHERLWQADYQEVGGQRVVILPEQQRKRNRAVAARSFIDDFGATERQADQIEGLKLPAGWEPFSIAALRVMLPRLQDGERFGALLKGPEREDWRNENFPEREQPTGEVMDRLPSPTDREERERIAGLRNPTVVRTRNELRKVVNNLIDMFGKPDRIRVEVTRDVGISKREREEKTAGIRKREGEREKAKKDLKEKGIAEPSRDDIEKWLLWEESGRRCPYTGDCIGFDALFREGKFEVEHIWPRSKSLDDSFRNKTLCRKDENHRKGNRIPFEYLGDTDRWPEIVRRLQDMKAVGNRSGMSPGKLKRFLSKSIPDDFAARQLNDTAYAAREAVVFLQRLWPDVGPQAHVKVQAVSGKVTAQLRKLWGLNKILGDTGEKTRANHRHHAIDALTVACAHPGMTQKLSGYWQAGESSGAEQPRLPPPWAAIRADAENAADDIIVSHRVQKKVSGPLHKETNYGDAGKEISTRSNAYRFFVKRKPVEALSKTELKDIRDPGIREIVEEWVKNHGGDPKKAFRDGYPKRSRKGPEIRKVRLTIKQQLRLMAQVNTGYAELGNNHHIAIFRLPNDRVDFEVVSLFEAVRRLSRREPVVRRERSGAQFVMSLSPGDALQFADSNGAKVRIVESVWANGQVVVRDHDDATTANATRKWPTVNSIVKAKKLSVDPVGRIRAAND